MVFVSTMSTYEQEVGEKGLSSGYGKNNIAWLRRLLFLCNYWVGQVKGWIRLRAAVVEGTKVRTMTTVVFYFLQCWDNMPCLVNVWLNRSSYTRVLLWLAWCAYKAAVHSAVVGSLFDSLIRPFLILFWGGGQWGSNFIGLLRTALGILGIIFVK